MNHTTIAQVFLSRRHSNSPAHRAKILNKWQIYSWSEYYNHADYLAHALKGLGVKPGDRICVFSNTRMEWAWVDLAAFGVGAVVVPIYQNAGDDEIEYILNHSEAQIVFVENQKVYNRMKSVRSKCAKIKSIIGFEPVRADGLELFQDVLNRGLFLRQEDPQFFAQGLQKSRPDDLATVVYTSGTTGLPKGVELTHRQIFAEVSSVFPYVGMQAEDVSLAFLPWAHILGRIEHWGHIFIGYEMAFAQNLERILIDLADVRPTVMVAVPRIFEKIHTAIIAGTAGNALLRPIFARALQVASRWSNNRRAGKFQNPFLSLQKGIFDLLFFNRVKAVFGGRTRFVVSGGAPLGHELGEFFDACGILVLEGYGLTETTAAICVNHPDEYRFGYVGKPIPHCEIKIDSDGEILVRGDMVMRGYYKDPAATNEVMTDGWFRSGDIGSFDDGFLKITDRKKDLIKTAGGKYVAPQRLETIIKTHPLVSQVLVHGDKRKYVVALVTIDRTYLLKWAKEKSLNIRIGHLATNADLEKEMQRHFRTVNSKLASFETVKKFKILADEFTVETGELTPSLKVKRKFCDQKFHALIESMYLGADEKPMEMD